MPRMISICFTVVCAVLFSCSVGGARREADSLSGDWITDKGIAVRVQRLSDNRLGAEIVSAAGFFTNDLGAGNVVLRNIRPFSNGYQADFIMPDNERPVQLRMRFLNRNTLLLESPDKRTQGNKMIWRRVRDAETE